MMYREFKITDEEGKKITVKVYPDEQNRVEIEGDYISFNLDQARLFDAMVCGVSQFMNTNTINKIEIKEKDV